MKITQTQLEQVNDRMQALIRSNSFYGKKLEAAGMTEVHTPEEFAKLPFSEKKDLRDAYPLGLMAVPEEEVVRIHSSSGTTGTPVIIPYTAKDVDDWAIQFKRCYETAGITKNITFHSYRRTFATLQAAAGTDIRTIQSIMAHKSITTTQRYMKVVDSNKRKASNKISLIRKS